MSEIIGYSTLIENIETAIKTNNKLDPDHADRYLDKIYKQRWIPGPPLPAILIWINNKPEETPLSIGVLPSKAIVTATIRFVDIFPNTNEAGTDLHKSALLTALTLSAVQTPEHADKVIYLLADEIEKTMKGGYVPTTNEKINVIRLYEPTKVKSCFPNSTMFGSDTVGGVNYVYVDVNLLIQLSLT